MARQVSGSPRWSTWGQAARISMILHGVSIDDVAKQIGASYQQVSKVLQETKISESYTVTTDHSTVREKMCDLLGLKHICTQSDTVEDILDPDLLRRQ